MPAARRTSPRARSRGAVISQERARQHARARISPLNSVRTELQKLQCQNRLPGRVDATLVLPPGAALVVDLPFAEEPLAVDLHQFVLVVAEAADGVAPLRIVVA